VDGLYHAAAQATTEGGRAIAVDRGAVRGL